MRVAKPIKVREYINSAGESPFRNWLKDLADAYRARIQARLLRVELGNLGDYKSLGDGVYELRLDFGPGFRIYFGMEGQAVVLLLLCGGDKATQKRDIAKAKDYWRDYLGDN